MRDLHTIWMLGAAMMLTLNGCTPAAQDSSSDRRPHGTGNDGAMHSKAQDDLRPTKLENCLTAVGADRSRCSAN